MGREQRPSNKVRFLQCFEPLKENIYPYIHSNSITYRAVCERQLKAPNPLNVSVRVLWVVCGVFVL